MNVSRLIKLTTELRENSFRRSPQRRIKNSTGSTNEGRIDL